MKKITILSVLMLVLSVIVPSIAEASTTNLNDQTSQVSIADGLESSSESTVELKDSIDSALATSQTEGADQFEETEGISLESQAVQKSSLLDEKGDEPLAVSQEQNVTLVEGVIPDQGLKAIINLNLSQDTGTEITVAMLKKLTNLNFDKVTTPTVVSDFSGLEYATKLVSFGSTSASDKGYNVTLTNLASLVTVANAIPTLEQLRFSWVKIPDVSPLANLTGTRLLWLNAETYGQDFSSLSKLLTTTKLEQLILTYNSTLGKVLTTIPQQDYLKDVGIQAIKPFILPEGLQFNFPETIPSTNWTYQGGFFRNDSLVVGASNAFTAQLSTSGTNSGKVFFGSSTIAVSSLVVSYPYNVPNLLGLKVKDSTLYVGDIWSAEDNFVGATDQNGNSVSLSSVTVTGSVDTTQAGQNEVSYSYGGITKTAVITVVADQTSLTVKDSELIVGDTWNAEDNFVGATDRDGNPVPFSSVTVTGTVDTTKVGTNEVSYTYGGVSETAVITVVADQTSLIVKDSELIVGDTWNAEDNFVGATDRDGNPVPFSSVTVTGTVDTTKVGTNEVSYTYGGISDTAVITVVADQTSLSVKDSELIVGDAWNAEDNFVGATDRDGNSVSLSSVTVTGSVDTTQAGQNDVSYSYGGITKTAVISVVADQTSLIVKDSELVVGDTWSAEDNFVGGTDRDGNPLPLNSVTITGTVDTTKVGTNEVSYTYGGISDTAVITVVADQTSLTVKDSELIVGDAWSAENNFVGGTDRDGNPLPLNSVTVTGSVDTTQAGQNKVSYSYGGITKTAVITVVADQTSLSVKDSELVVGDTWNAEDNFVGATDRDGNPVSLSSVTVTGSVDTTQAGQNEVSYSYGGITKTAVITVVADQTSLSVKDSELIVGDTWSAEDNFVGATDRDGNSVSLSSVTVTGSVDTTQAGQDEVSYSYGGITKTAVITVVANQTSIIVKNSTLFIGDTWSASDNFISATDRYGNSIYLLNGINRFLNFLTFDSVSVTGTVDTAKAGTNKVSYTYGGVIETAVITVVADLTSLTVKDSELIVGDTWNAEDNFVGATDRDGNPLPLNSVTVTGSVDTTQAGQNKVSYSYGGITKTAVITVIADQTSLIVKDSELVVGDTWSAEDNFVGGTDRDGNPLPLNSVTITGTVDTTKVGVINIIYTYNGINKTATITVIADQTSLSVKDSELMVGDTWKPEDNFVSGTDREGKAIEFSNVVVNGTVDTTVSGKYQVSYSYGGMTKTATVLVKETVIAKPKPEITKKPSIKSNQGSKQYLPKAGEKQQNNQIIFGLLLIMLLGVVYSKKKKY